jgi:hypothetical protein
VECRAESRGEERPVAVWIGGRRLAVTEVEDGAVEGPSVAGAPLRRWLDLRLEDGRGVRVERPLADGEWEVEERTGSR